MHEIMRFLGYKSIRRHIIQRGFKKGGAVINKWSEDELWYFSVEVLFS